MEFFIALKARNFFCRNIFDHINFATCVCTVSCVGVFDQFKLKLVKFDSLSIPVVRILAECDV